jgi:OmpA-OmpF porin, OOP family
MRRSFAGFFLFYLVFFFFSAPGWAQGTDVANSQDHPLISRYAGSIILGYDVRDYDSFTLPLGKQGSDSKTGAVLLTTKRILEGKVTRILYASPVGRSSLEILRNYQQSLSKAGFEILYSCAQNQCGERLNLVLYPLDRRLKNSGQISEYALEFPKDQRYLAARLTGADGTWFVSVFVGVCGINNFKETFNHPITLLEVVETKAMETGLVTVNAEAMAKEIEKTGHVSIYGIYFDTDKTEIKPASEPVLTEISKLLRLNPQLKVYLVGHTDNVGNLNYNLDLSQRRAGRGGCFDQTVRGGFPAAFGQGGRSPGTCCRQSRRRRPDQKPTCGTGSTMIRLHWRGR